VMVLEERRHALARGAAIHGEIVGYAAAGEPDEPDHPDEPGDPSGLEEPLAAPGEPGRRGGQATDAPRPRPAPAPGRRALTRVMRQALAEAEWELASLGCLLPGGTASAAQRLTEEAALRNLDCRPGGAPPASPPCRFDPTPRLGHALAAQAPIGLCLALALPVAGTRLLCNSLGLLGQAVALAVDRAPGGRDEAAAARHGAYS